MHIVAPVADVRAGPDRDAELVTQVILGEEVTPLAPPEDGWIRIACPEQPSALDERGYPGWVRADAVSTDDEATGPAGGDRHPSTVEEFIAAARAFDGAPYLWGGMTRDGIDCSGLVHMALRVVGVRVPRDAADQHRAVRAIPIDDLRPGDLCFFAVGGADVHHVGVATRPGVMLHAPEVGVGVVEEELDDAHRATFVGGGRIFE